MQAWPVERDIARCPSPREPTGLLFTGDEPELARSTDLMDRAPKDEWLNDRRKMPCADLWIAFKGGARDLHRRSPKGKTPSQSVWQGGTSEGPAASSRATSDFWLYPHPRAREKAGTGAAGARLGAPELLGQSELAPRAGHDRADRVRGNRWKRCNESSLRRSQRRDGRRPSKKRFLYRRPGLGHRRPGVVPAARAVTTR